MDHANKNGSWSHFQAMPCLVEQLLEQLAGLLVRLFVDPLAGRLDCTERDSEDPEKRCTKCTDARKDLVLRGMAIVTGMRVVDGEYSGGEILDPDTGGVYRSSMRLSEDGRRLTVRGYIGIPLFGRSQEWVRAD